MENNSCKKYLGNFNYQGTFWIFCMELTIFSPNYFRHTQKKALSTKFCPTPYLTLFMYSSLFPLKFYVPLTPTQNDFLDFFTRKYEKLISKSFYYNNFYESP